MSGAVRRVAVHSPRQVDGDGVSGAEVNSGFGEFGPHGVLHVTGLAVAAASGEVDLDELAEQRRWGDVAASGECAEFVPRAYGQLGGERDYGSVCHGVIIAVV